MHKKHAYHLLFALFALVVLFPEIASAAPPLRCTGGQPEAGSSLYDDSASGACRFVGIRYIFSTIICQFVVMINVIMGKLYCSVQAAVQPIVMLAVVVFVAIYGVQMLMGTAQLNSNELVTRSIKMSLVVWLVTDPVFGVSAGISYMFEFFVSFISESTRWVVKVLDEGSGMGIYQNFAQNAGVTAMFYYIDDWIYSALTGSLSDANAKVVAFFISMSFIMPSLAILAFYWLASLVKMLINTLISFMMAVVSVSFLLGLSPIFISFMLFRVTYVHFDQWLKFMMSYSIQVMISFAILTMWLFSLTLFGPFFNQISDVLFPYQKVVRPAAAIYNPVDTIGLCPLRYSYDPLPSIGCQKANFNPISPGEQGFPDGNEDYKRLIPPSKVPELSSFLFFVFYHLMSLIIVTYGFASLQKNSSSIATKLAGPSYVPILNQQGVGMTSFGQVQDASGDADKFMSKGSFNPFSRRHESGATPYEQMVGRMRGMVSGRGAS